MTSGLSATPATTDLVFEYLLAQSKANRHDTWTFLEAAHVRGQGRFLLHLRSHWHMLVLAARESDAKEVIGQLFRLSLVPLGHLAGRLPAGNPGRATVSAFEPMPVRAELRQVIAHARAQVGGQ